MCAYLFQCASFASEHGPSPTPSSCHVVAQHDIRPPHQKLAARRASTLWYTKVRISSDSRSACSPCQQDVRVAQRCSTRCFDTPNRRVTS